LSSCLSQYWPPILIDSLGFSCVCARAREGGSSSGEQEPQPQTAVRVRVRMARLLIGAMDWLAYLDVQLADGARLQLRRKSGSGSGDLEAERVVWVGEGSGRIENCIGF
jgi:hypothetical protein